LTKFEKTFKCLAIRPGSVHVALKLVAKFTAKGMITLAIFYINGDGTEEKGMVRGGQYSRTADAFEAKVLTWCNVAEVSWQELSLVHEYTTLVKREFNRSKVLGA